MKEKGQMKIGRSLLLGFIGGIVGGILFGVLMQMKGGIAMLAGMFGSTSLVIGWGIHMMISIIFGIAFGILAIKTTRIYFLGFLYGVLIWIIGPLVAMPLMAGMGTNLAHAFAPEQLMSLLTHLFFSFIVAIVYKMLAPKQEKSNSYPA